MVRTMVIAACLLVVIGSASAQTANVWKGELTGDNVRVRSGPNLNWYAMAKLSKPAQVTVTGRKDKWLAIVPPTGTYSVIRKLFCKVEGTTGTVTGDRVTIRAGSALHPTRFSCIQTYLNKGATVKVVGQTEEYYKIAPPASIRVFISADFVKPVAGGATVSGGPGTSGGTTTKPVGNPTTKPAGGTTTKTTGGTTTKPAGGGLSARIKAFQAAEAVLMAEYAKPREQRDHAALIARYMAIDAPAGGPVRARIDWRVRFLTRAIDRAKGIEEARRLMAEAQAEKRQLEAFLARTRPTGAANTKPTDYSVVGRITPSGLYPGSGVAPKRWIVRDDAGVILCLVQNTGVRVDLRGAEGWKIALKGIRKYDAGTRAFIVEAASVVKLPGGEPIVPKRRVVIPPPPIPVPPKPVTPPNPNPKPEPESKSEPEPTSPPVPADVPETTETEPEPSPVNPDEYN